MNWPEVAAYLIDHAPTIIGAIATGIVLVRQSANSRKAVEAHTETTMKIEDVQAAVENGYSSAIVKAADVAAAKVVEQADIVAAKLSLIKTADYSGPDRRAPEKTP